MAAVVGQAVKWTHMATESVDPAGITPAGRVNAGTSR